MVGSIGPGAPGMPKLSKDSDNKRDWRISVTLGAVWLVALVFVGKSDIDIPVSMLAVATIFFILLIPAMNDLVRSIERISMGRLDSSEQEQNSGGNHE
jgi:hypothetical protein